jgi:hypothetical protein
LETVPFIESARLLDRNQLERIPAASGIACLDAGKVTFPVTIKKRKWRLFLSPWHGKEEEAERFSYRQQVSLPEKEKIFVMESGTK